MTSFVNYPLPDVHQTAAAAAATLPSTPGVPRQAPERNLIHVKVSQRQHTKTPAANLVSSSSLWAELPTKDLSLPQQESQVTTWRPSSRRRDWREGGEEESEKTVHICVNIYKCFPWKGVKKKPLKKSNPLNKAGNNLFPPSR